MFSPSALERSLHSLLASTSPPLTPMPALPYPPPEALLNLQLFLLMNSTALQQNIARFASMPVATSKEIAVETKAETESSTDISPAPSTSTASSAFSIDSILDTQHKATGSDVTDVKQEAAIYTLDALEGSDGRSKEGERRNDSRCTCDVCGKSYATASNLSRHKQTHRSMDSPHAKQCPHCDRVYVSMPALSMHLLTHNAQHSCGICGKSFSRLWLLQGHLRSHTGARPFGCAHCGKYFADRSNLRAHILTHTGIKKFNCDSCGKRFALRSYLNRHQETACKVPKNELGDDFNA